MPPSVINDPVENDVSVREAVCIHTEKIYDSCKDKDCLEDLRVYPTFTSRPVIESAVSIRARSAELIYAQPDVEPVSFNRGHYSIDIRYFYQIRGDAYTLAGSVTPVSGLAVFCKRVILFGSEGNAKKFTSNAVLGGLDPTAITSTNLPTAVVEAVDPIVLDMKLADVCSPCPVDYDIYEVPGFIKDVFGDDISFESGQRRWLVTLGQFSIIRLERDTQLLIPAYDYCMPDKDCCGSDDGDPCSQFSRICFPVDEFFPPDTVSCPEGYREAMGTFQK